MNVDLLKKICEIPGAPGFEKEIRSFLMKEVKPYVDEVRTDAMGNLIALKKGKGEKSVLVAAHMDEIGFIVNHIDEEGFIRFHTLGGFDPKTLTAQRVLIHGKEDVIGVMGAKPIHVMTAEEKLRVPKTTDYFIDTGMPKSEVVKLISIGDPITRERTLIEMGDCVNSKSIDNRVSVYILLETLKKLKDENVEYDIYGVFTVQEEIGLRGATAIASGVNPDYSLGLDTTIAYDMPGAKPEEMITKLGSGTAIKIMDSSAICDYRMVSYLKGLANKNSIKWQAEILPRGGTDTGALQRSSNGGSIAGAISIPTRNLHQVIEMANKHDIDASIELLTLAVTNLDSHDWSF